MEGPSLVILKEEMQPFIGKEVLHVSGNSKIEQNRILHQTLLDVKTFGKQFLLCFDGFTLRTHFLLYGSYRINAEKEYEPRLSLQFENGVLNMYICSVRYIEEPLESLYDWGVDVMSDERDAKKVLSLVKKRPHTIVSDILLDQTVFAGVGNIIKNEVLFRLKIHPESHIGGLSLKQQKALVEQGHEYSCDFYRWKKVYELRKHYQVYTKKSCPNCMNVLTKKKVGKTNRRTFFCEHCQILYINNNP